MINNVKICRANRVVARSIFTEQALSILTNRFYLERTFNFRTWLRIDKRQSIRVQLGCDLVRGRDIGDYQPVSSPDCRR